MPKQLRVNPDTAPDRYGERRVEVAGLHGVTSDHLADRNLGRPGVGPRGHQVGQREPSIDLAGTAWTVQKIPFRMTVAPTVPTKEPLEISTFALKGSGYLLTHSQRLPGP